MKIGVALYGAARVVIGQPGVEVSFDTPTIALGQVVEQLIAAYPRARPYLLDESGMLPSHIRILINEVRPTPMRRLLPCYTRETGSPCWWL